MKKKKSEKTTKWSKAKKKREETYRWKGLHTHMYACKNTLFWKQCAFAPFCQIGLWVIWVSCQLQKRGLTANVEEEWQQERKKRTFIKDGVRAAAHMLSCTSRSHYNFIFFFFDEQIKSGTGYSQEERTRVQIVRLLLLTWIKQKERGIM